MVNITVTTGIWEDHSHSGWEKFVLTLDTRRAGFLLSALATFITLVGGCFWSIVAFTIHQVRASDEKKDGLHHQYQVTYKSSSTALGIAFAAIKISWTWRGRARHNFLRTVAVVIPPILCFVSFAIASVFASRVTTAPYLANKVRLSKQNCGFLDWSASSNIIGEVPEEGVSIYGEYFVNAALAARNYARSCYGSQAQHLASCNLYPVQNLPYTTNLSARCPFELERCITGENGAIQMETPWLNSHEDFGINSPPENRVEYRKITTCSVLNVTDLVSSRPTSSGTFYYWHLGYTGPLTARTNITYTYNDNTANLGIGYTIQPNFAVNRDDYPGWIPIPDIQRSDADVSIFFLAQNSVVYPRPVDDPFYSAHRMFSGSSTISGTQSVWYAADELVTVMGCIDQAQIRDPTTNNSTNLSGFQDLSNHTSYVGLNVAQLAAAARLIISSETSMMWNSVNGLQSAALKAQDSLYIITSSGIPDNQWQIEVQGWFDNALAHLQSSVIEFVAKDIDGITPYANLSFPPMTEQELQQMCDNQVILNVGNYQSFSLMGVEIIVVVGGIIVLLSLVLDKIVGCCQRRWGKRKYKELLWTMDSVLQQQRLAARDKGFIDWENVESAIPLTKRDITWKSISLTDVDQKEDKVIKKFPAGNTENGRLEQKDDKGFQRPLRSTKTA